MSQGCAWLSAIVFTTVGLGSAMAADDTAPPAPESLKIITYAVADLATPVSNPSAGERSADLEALIDLIVLRTGSDCWSEGGGEGTIAAYEKTLSLVVRQTPSAHERIADLLSELRTTLELAIVVDVRIISGDLAACEFETELGTSPFGLVDEEAKANLLESVQENLGLNVLHAPKVTALNGQSASITIGNALSMNLSSVVTGDHRYARVWLDVTTGGQSHRSELLIPDGCTAVRELEPGKSWMLVGTQVLHSREPEEAVPASFPERSAERFLVPAEEPESDVTTFRNGPAPLIDPDDVRVAAATLRWRAAEPVPQRIEDQPRLGAIPRWIGQFEAGPIAPGEPSFTDPGTPLPHLYGPMAPDAVRSDAVSHPRMILRLITPSDDETPAPIAVPVEEQVEKEGSKSPPVAVGIREMSTVISNFRIEPPRFDIAWTRSASPLPECTDCNSRHAKHDRFVTPASAEMPYSPPTDQFTAAARLLDQEGLSDLATELRSLSDRIRRERATRLSEIDREIERLTAEKERLQTIRTPAPFVYESAVELPR
jgi:hypothetical protein